MSDLRCPGCDRVVTFESSSVVRVLYDQLADGRYIVRAVGRSAEFEISDGELDFVWTPDMKPRGVWVLHECSYGGGGHDRAAVPSPAPALTQYAEDPSRSD